jgi:hypothetical protein
MFHLWGSSSMAALITKLGIRGRWVSRPNRFITWETSTESIWQANVWDPQTVWTTWRRQEALSWWESNYDYADFDCFFGKLQEICLFNEAGTNSGHTQYKDWMIVNRIWQHRAESDSEVIEDSTSEYIWRVKVKFTLEQAMKAKRSRGIDLLFL